MAGGNQFPQPQQNDDRRYQFYQFLNRGLVRVSGRRRSACEKAAELPGSAPSAENSHCRESGVSLEKATLTC